MKFPKMQKVYPKWSKSFSNKKQQYFGLWKDPFNKYHFVALHNKNSAKLHFYYL